MDREYGMTDSSEGPEPETGMVPAPDVAEERAKTWGSSDDQATVEPEGDDS